jgi:hypothetical protein
MRAMKNETAAKMINKLLRYVALISLFAVAVLVGYLASHYPLLAGVILGLVVGCAFGFMIGVAALMFFAALDLEAFVALFKKGT